MTIITDLDGTQRPSSYLFEMYKHGCLSMDQLNEMLLKCAAFPWVAQLCQFLRPHEKVQIITAEGTEHAEQVQMWVDKYIPHSPVHVQLLGDEIFFPGQPVNWDRHDNIKCQAYDDAIAIASAHAQVGESVVVMEDNPRLVAHVIAKHMQDPRLIVVHVGGQGKITVAHRGNCGNARLLSWLMSMESGA